MTTLGKILVFLVFIAALAMGGLMVFVARTTPNWKVAVDERNEKIGVYKSMLAQEAESRQKLVNENEKLKQLLDGSSLDKTSTIQRIKLELADKEKQLRGAEEQRGKADLLAKQAQTQAARLEKELEFLTQNVVNERDKTVLKLQADLAQARNEEQAAKNDVLTMKNRMQSLVDQVKEKDRILAELTKKGQPTVGVAATGPKDATFRNPPSVFAKGQIEQVDNTGLVRISIGSDAGIRRDHTLEVFRISPKAEFLGTLLVTETDFNYAIGRLLPQPGVATPALRPGDQVASSLRQQQ